MNSDFTSGLLQTFRTVTPESVQERTMNGVNKSRSDGAGTRNTESRDIKYRGGCKEIKLPMIESAAQHSFVSLLFDIRAHDDAGKKSFTKLQRLEVQHAEIFSAAAQL